MPFLPLFLPLYFASCVCFSMLILSKKPYLRSIKIINGNIYFKKEKRYMKKQLLYSLAALTLAACGAEKQDRKSTRLNSSH